MIFLRGEIEDELCWSFRCKGCGEIYNVRPVAGAEVGYPQSETIQCHQTADIYSYATAEMEQLWVP